MMPTKGHKKLRKKRPLATPGGNLLLALIVALYGINSIAMIVYVHFLDEGTNSLQTLFSTSNLANKAATLYCPKSSSASMTTTTTTTTTRSKYHPTILWGIPTYDGKEEEDRRQAIRETYLSFYKGSSETPNRICSLANYTCWDATMRSDCQMVYTFFMGANPKAPTERLEDFDDFRKMTTSHPVLNKRHKTTLEPDIAYLDIRENQFDGKMTTWFHFGSVVAKEFPEIQFVAKVDSDTIVFVPNFLEYMAQHLPKPQNQQPTLQRVYVGRANDKYSCDLTLKNHDHACPLPLVGDFYMAGDLNMMSADLADYITSPKCPRQNVTIATHEDVSMGNYVFTHPQTVTSVVVSRKQLLLTPNADMDFGPVDFKVAPENYTHYLWGHSKRQKNFDYFKSLRNYHRMWKHFQRYWYKERKETKKNTRLARTTTID